MKVTHTTLAEGRVVYARTRKGIRKRLLQLREGQPTVLLPEGSYQVTPDYRVDVGRTVRIVSTVGHRGIPGHDVITTLSSEQRPAHGFAELGRPRRKGTVNHIIVLEEEVKRTRKEI